MTQTWEARERVFALLDSQPQTLCHYDVWPKNLVAQVDDRGNDRTALVDWAFAGIGPVGHDAANLILDALLSFYIDIERAHELYQSVLQGYVQGLSDAGYAGDEGVVRTTVGAVAAVKYLWKVASLLRNAGDEARLSDLERKHKRSAKEIYGAHAAFIYFLQDLAGATRTDWDGSRS